MEGMDPRARLIRIGIIVLLMASAVYVTGRSLTEGQEGAVTNVEPIGATPSLPVESGVFSRASMALSYAASAEVGTGHRTLREFYSRRAYPGAPPMIPHDVEDERTIGGNDCLSCHRDGGFAPSIGEYAPVTPHPDYLNCRQCHVPQNTPRVFRGNSFRSETPPEIDRSWLEGSPPQIPHSLQLRENCLSCHAGPGAVVEIRSDHPERVNCRQCHALANADTDWVRP